MEFGPAIVTEAPADIEQFAMLDPIPTGCWTPALMSFPQRVAHQWYASVLFSGGRSSRSGTISLSYRVPSGIPRQTCQKLFEQVVNTSDIQQLKPGSQAGRRVRVAARLMLSPTA